jgi:hypothetical protein
LKHFFVKIYGILCGTLLTVKNFPVDLFCILKNFISTYFELFKTGGFQSKAKGEKVCINFQANISGDILIFIEPLNPGVYSYDDVLKLVVSDNILKQQKVIALHSLQQKFQGLMVLPKMFAGLISAFFALIVYWNAALIQAILNYQINLVAIQKVVPLVILLIALIFRKFIGFRLISIIIWLINFIRRIWLRLKALFQ